MIVDFLDMNNGIYRESAIVEVKQTDLDGREATNKELFTAMTIGMIKAIDRLTAKVERLCQLQESILERSNNNNLNEEI